MSRLIEERIVGESGEAEHRVRLEPCPRRVRNYVAGVVVADSSRVRTMFETNHLPVYYFPLEDVAHELLVPSEHTSHCPYKGDARYYSVKVGETVRENAVWHYPEPLPDAPPELAGLVAFYWSRMDSWFEEDDEVYVHPRDPYRRVDVLNSSRHVVVQIEGETVADTHRPRLLFETTLPTRYYIPRVDTRMELLEPSETTTRCPYKGMASYFSVRLGERLCEDIAWYYPSPIPECSKIENLVCFYNEKVDIYVDGELEERPVTHFT